MEARDDHGDGKRRQTGLDLAQALEAILSSAAVVVAVRGDEDAWLDLPEAGEHAGDAKVRRARGEHGADRRGRERDDDRFGHVRQPRSYAVSGADARRGQRGGARAHLLADLTSRQLAPLPGLVMGDDRRL